MPIRSQPDFRTTELAPGILATPFQVQTNWHVITGAPSCGKTTLIDLLADKGFRTVPEVARQFMEREIARGRTIEEIHAHGAALQRRIEDLQVCVESVLRAEEVLFLDGGVPSSLAWFRAFGLDPNEILPECFQHRYASVFILDRLPLHLDGLRFEEDTFSGFLDQWFSRDYSALGYQVLRLPVLEPKERLRLVLERLSGQGLI